MSAGSDPNYGLRHAALARMRRLNHGQHTQLASVVTLNSYSGDHRRKHHRARLGSRRKFAQFASIEALYQSRLETPQPPSLCVSPNTPSRALEELHHDF